MQRGSFYRSSHTSQHSDHFEEETLTFQDGQAVLERKGMGRQGGTANKQTLSKLMLAQWIERLPPWKLAALDAWARRR